MPRAKLSDGDQAHLSEIEPLVSPPGPPEAYQVTPGLTDGAVAEQMRRQSEDIRRQSEEIQRQAEAIRGQHDETRSSASRRIPSEPSVSLSDAKEAFATAKPLPMQAAGNSVYTPDPLPVSAAPLNLPTFAHECAGGNAKLVLSPQRTAFVIVTNAFSSAKQTIAVGTAEQTTTLETDEGQSVLAVRDNASHIWMGSPPNAFAAHRIERWLVSDERDLRDATGGVVADDDARAERHDTLAHSPSRLSISPQQRHLCPKGPFGLAARRTAKTAVNALAPVGSPMAGKAHAWPRENSRVAGRKGGWIAGGKRLVRRLIDDVRFLLTLRFRLQTGLPGFVSQFVERLAFFVDLPPRAKTELPNRRKRRAPAPDGVLEKEAGHGHRQENPPPILRRRQDTAGQRQRGGVCPQHPLGVPLLVQIL